MDSINNYLQTRIFAIGALAMGISLLSSAFEFFYVKVFLNIHKMDPLFFQAAIIIVIIYSFRDNIFLRPNADFRLSLTWESYMPYISVLLAFSFLMPWFILIEQYVFLGVYFSVCLRLWNETGPYRGLAYCCSLMENSNDAMLRMRIIRSTQIGNMFGSLSIFFLYYLSNQLESFRAFQTTSVIIAVVSLVLMLDFRRYSFTVEELIQKDNAQTFESLRWLEENDNTVRKKQILNNQSFQAFVIINLFQEFHRMFLSNFLLIFGDQLIDDATVSLLGKSVFYSGSVVAAKVYCYYLLSTFR